MEAPSCGRCCENNKAQPVRGTTDATTFASACGAREDYECTEISVSRRVKLCTATFVCVCVCVAYVIREEAGLAACKLPVGTLAVAAFDETWTCVCVRRVCDARAKCPDRV